jgi:outer membrane protein assembly factor BamB
MKGIWWKVSVLIIAVVLQNFLYIPQASHLTEKHENEKEKQNLQYMNDWHVQLDSITTANERDSSVSRNENSSCDIPIKPIVCSTGGPMDSAWPMQSHDAHHTGLSPYSTANNSGVEIWQVHGESAGGVESSAVIDKNSIIYFGTKGSDSSLYALHPNGTQKWKYKSDGLIWDTPAIAEDGTLYFTTWGGYGNLHAVYPNGTQRWLFNDGYDSVSTSSPAIGEDGTIYFGSDHNKIYAVNPDGTERWQYLTGNIAMGSPAIGQDGTIYIGSGDHYLYALYPNGTLRWRFNTGSYIKGSASLADDGTIYVPSFNSYFYALYPNGTLKWKAYTGDSTAAAGVALSGDGTIYVGTELLRAFCPNGTLKWSADVQGDIYGTVPAVSADGTIYVSAGLSLVAVNPDGTEKWRRVLTTQDTRSSPCIGEDGIIYVGSRSGDYGYLHAFGNGDPKQIEIEQPEPGKLYLFGLGMSNTLSGNTLIIGSVKVKVHVYSEAEIESVHFYIDGTDQYFVTKPPYEWNMNRRFGDLFPLKHTITVTGYYEGGYSWSESIDVLYFHFF